VRERIADRLGELTLPADEGELFAQPRFEFGEKRTRSFLADGASLVRPAATNVGFHPIERGDALQRLVGDGRRFGDGAFVEAAPQMRPAEGEADVTFVCKRAIAGVAVDLKDALEARKMRDRLGPLAVGRVDIGGRRRVGYAPGPIVPRIGPEWPVLVRRLPGSSTDAVVPSPNSFVEDLRCARMRSWTGRRWNAAHPTQSSSVERSRRSSWRW
jgi:hypothetical protein